MAGVVITEKHCMICGFVEPHRIPPHDVAIIAVEPKDNICPECKRAVMYARELLKRKEESGYFTRPEY